MVVECDKPNLVGSPKFQSFIGYNTTIFPWLHGFMGRTVGILNTPIAQGSYG